MCRAARRHVAILGFALPVTAFAQGAATPLVAPTELPDRSPHQERFIAVNGARLQVLDWGGSGPVLLFLPGFGHGAHIFDDIAPAFNNQYHVLALTPRGFPRSSAPDVGYTITQLAADVVAVLDSLGARRAVLAGHSISGAVITRFAELYADRLRAAIYLDAAFDFGPVLRAAQERPIGGPPSTLDTTARSYQEWRRRYQVVSTARLADGHMWNIDSADAVRRHALVMPLADEVRSHPHETWRVTAPALAICAVNSVDRAYGWLTRDSARWRTADSVAKQAAAAQRAVCDQFRRAGPHRQAVDLDSGHFVFIDRRDDVVTIMRKFLSRVP